MKQKLTFKQIIIAAFKAAFFSIVINVILFYIYKQVGFITDDIVIQPGQPLQPLYIVISSLIPTLLGAVVFFLLEKYTNNGFKIFSIISLILLGLSFVNPFLGIKGVTTEYAIALDTMHVVVALSLLYFLSKLKVQ